MTLLDIRRACHYILHRSIGKWGKFWNAFFATLIILSVAAAPLHFVDRLSGEIEIFDGVIVIIFTLEYLLLIWSAAYPVRMLFSWVSVVELMAIVPFYLAFFGVTTFHTAAFFLPLRILKLGKIYELERISVSKICEKQHGDFHALPNETIERVVHRHPVVFFFGLLPVFFMTSGGLLSLVFFTNLLFKIGAAVFFFGIAFLFFFKSWLDFHYDVIYITNRRIIVQNRQLFGSRLNDISYEAITNIKPDTTSFWHFVFGFGDIQIETAAAKENQIFSDASDAEKVVEDIARNRQRVLLSDNVTTTSSTGKNVLRQKE